MNTDVAWLQRCASGDPAACRELVDRHSRLLGTIVLRALGRPDGVEDLVQEVFLKVFRALPEYEGRSKLSTWMCTIAHRVAMDELRRRQRQPLVVANADFEEPVDDADLERDFLQAERDARVRRALSTLPERYRLPLVYAAIDELDYDTIATMLSLPLGTVKTNIHRAKALLREQLATEFATQEDRR